MLKLILFVGLCLLKIISGANILYICPIASPSHHIWNRALALELVNKGHNVTMLTHDQEDKPTRNFTIVLLEGMYDVLHEQFGMEEVSESTTFETIKVMYDYSLFSIDYDMKTNGLKTLIDYPKHSFDLIIYDITIGLYLLPLVEIFNNPPVVAVTPFLLPPSAATIFGSPLYTSYMPFYCTHYTDKMNLEERFYNFIFTYADVFYFKYIYSPEEERRMKSYFPANSLTPKEIARNIPILLTNTDPYLEYPTPLSPNVIQVGGLHARPSRPLPADLQKIVDAAKHGVIVFSLGTNLRSDKLDVNIRKAFLKAFSKLNQVILWKFETEKIENLPKNVHLRKWLPINDLLGHSNTILFINHGGALSTQEAIYHGVPLIGIPHFADQHINVRRIVAKKIASSLNKDELTYENIDQALTTMLQNPEYTTNVKSLSRQFRSQPQTALEKAVFWVEHVLIHGDTDHLSVRARDLSSFEVANIDVALIILLGFSAVLVVMYVIVLQVLKLFRRTTKVKLN